MDEIYHKDTLFHIEMKCDHITKNYIFLGWKFALWMDKMFVVENLCNILQWMKLCSSIKVTTHHKYVTIDIHQWVESCVGSPDFIHYHLSMWFNMVWE
jgi:hypothetical protein